MLRFEFLQYGLELLVRALDSGRDIAAAEERRRPGCRLKHRDDAGPILLAGDRRVAAGQGCFDQIEAHVTGLDIRRLAQRNDVRLRAADCSKNPRVSRRRYHFHRRPSLWIWAVPGGCYTHFLLWGKRQHVQQGAERWPYDVPSYAVDTEIPAIARSPASLLRHRGRPDSRSPAEKRQRLHHRAPDAP